MGDLIGTLLALALMVGFLFFGKWIFACIAILCGSKDAIHEFGNLCKDDPPPRNGVEWDRLLERWRKDDEWRRRGEGNML